MPTENYVPLTYETKIIRPGRFFHLKLKLSENDPCTLALQAVDASRHHQMFANRNILILPLKTIAPYCWCTHGEYDSLPLCMLCDLYWFGLVCCGLTSQSVIFQLYSDGTVVQFSKF